MVTFRLFYCVLSILFLISFLVNGTPNCPLSCQDANQNCKSNCQLSSDDSANNIANIVTLEVGEPLPSDIQQGPPVWPRGDKECRGANAVATKETFPGKVTGITTECEEATQFEQRKVSIKWGPPEKYKTHRVLEYEIAYKVETLDVYNALGVECIYKDNSSRGVIIVKSIGKNQYLDIAVTALPKYKNLSTTMIKVTCLGKESLSTPPPTPFQEDNDESSPLNITLIVGSVAGSFCFLLFVIIVVKLLLGSSIRFGSIWQKDTNSEKYDSAVSVGYAEKEQQYERQLTRETALRGSIMTIHSEDMNPVQFSTMVTPNTKVDLAKATKVYISYYPDSEAFKSSLLSLIARLRNHHNINVIIDELDNRTIDKLGLANWCTSNLSKADKVMMVVTPKYIQALKHNDAEGNIPHDTHTLDKNAVRKIRLETHYINSKLFIQNQRSSSLVVLLAGTKEADLPPYLSGRNHYEWPTLESDSERRLIYCLNEVEDFVV